MADRSITEPKALALYQADKDAKIGPAMAALPNDRMRGFVHALIQTGCNNSRAALLAGYQGNSDVLKATGWKLAHDERIQAALEEEARKLIRSTSVMAINVVVDIAKDTKLDAKDRLRAAVELLNRSGLQARNESHVVIEHQLDRQAKIERIHDMAIKLGIDPVKLIGHANVTDAEFTPVAAAMSAEGLEDVL
jgi:hypothetical protein